MITIIIIGIMALTVALILFFNTDFEKVVNKERKFGSPEKYIRIKNLLFTENEIKIAKERAEKNKEDL